MLAGDEPGEVRGEAARVRGRVMRAEPERHQERAHEHGGGDVRGEQQPRELGDRRLAARGTSRHALSSAIAPKIVLVRRISA